MPKNKTRLLILSNTLSTFGGGERWALELAKRIRKDYGVKIVNPVSKRSAARTSEEYLRKEYSLRDNEILTLHCTGVSRSAFGGEQFILMVPSLAAVGALYNGIKEADVVYIISLNPILFYLTTKFAKMLKKRVILGLHNPFFPALFDRAPNKGALSWIYRRQLNCIDAFHAFNSDDAKLVSENYPDAKVYMIPHFATGSAAVMRTTPNKAFVVLFVGRLETYHKGIDLLRSVIQKTLKLNNAIFFHVVGAGTDGDSLVKNFAEAYPRNVVWRGFLEHKALDTEYSNASVFVLTSRFETFGLSLLEAQAFGIPAVAFDVKGPRDILQKQLQGTLIPDFDTDKFAEAIVKYYEEWRVGGSIAYRTKKLKICAYIAGVYSEKKIIPKIKRMLDAK